MAQGKQAKILSEAEITLVLDHLGSTQWPERNRVMFLLSIRAGLRAKEISNLTWSMVTDASGHLSDRLALPNRASKGHRGGRTIPLHRELKAALSCLHESEGFHAASNIGPDTCVIANQTSPAAVANWFEHLYKRVRLQGCSSHSGRRTAITNWARKIEHAGGSLRDVQRLAGHASLLDTQRYIEPSQEAQERLMELC